jgi:hypothetical protein
MPKLKPWQHAHATAAHHKLKAVVEQNIRAIMRLPIEQQEAAAEKLKALIERFKAKIEAHRPESPIVVHPAVQPDALMRFVAGHKRLHVDTAPIGPSGVKKGGADT